MASFHVDFPRMIPRSYSDTVEPRNLYDWELRGNTSELPVSRPLSEPTPITYLIVKGRFLDTLSRVTDFNSNLHLGSYEAVVDIDHALQRELDSIPLHMNVILPDNNIKPHAPEDHMWYPNLQLVGYFHLGMCNLHRRFMLRVREDNRFKLSRERCVSSAISLMKFQWDLHPSLYHLSSSRQTFALAPMLIFLELELRKNDKNEEAAPDNACLLELLGQVVARWNDATCASDDSRKVYQLLKSMLSGYQPRPDGVPIPLRAMSSRESSDIPLPGTFSDTFGGGTFFDGDTTQTSFDWVRIRSTGGQPSFLTSSGYMGCFYRRC